MFHSHSPGTFRRRAARQKRKSSTQENGGTVPHDALITNGIRQRKAQQPAGSGSGKLNNVSFPFKCKIISAFYFSRPVAMLVLRNQLLSLMEFQVQEIQSILLLIY